MSISRSFLRSVIACTVVGGWTLSANAGWVEMDTSTAHVTKSLENTYDAEGNPTQVIISQRVVRADGVVESMTTLNENTYYPSDLANWRLGQVDTVKATHTQGSSVITTLSKLVYDASTGMVAQEIANPNNPDFKVVTGYGRDAWGNITRKSVRADFSSDPARRVAESATTTTYDSTLHMFPVSESNALGHTISRTYDYANGYLLSETGLNGLTVRYQYDLLGRTVASMGPDGTKTLTTYASCSGDSNCPALGKFSVKTVVVKDPDNALPAGGAADLAGTPMGPESYVYFDALRRDLYSRAQSIDGRWAIAGLKELNAKGQVLRSAEPYFQGETALQWTSFDYDVYGRVIKTTQPKGTFTTVAYAPLKTTYTNELNQKKVEESGLQSQPVRITEGFGSSDEATTLYSYDALGRMLSITDAAGKVRSYSYDQAGNKLTDNDPNQGTWTYSYNALGQLLSQTDAKNQTTRISYDVLGRITKREAADFNSQWTYDTAVNGKGKLAQATASNGYLRTHSYDSLGRLVQTTTTVDNQSYNLSTTYDSQGRIQGTTYPTGFSYKNEYNALGFLTKVKSEDGLRTYWQISDSAGANASDAMGRVLKATLGNGIVVNRSYDAKTGQLSGQWSGNNGAFNNVQNEVYQFNDAGNLQSRTDYLSNLSETFQYDALNRLTSATVLGQAAQTVQYDKVGNILFKSDVGYYRYNAAHPQAVADICRNGFAADGNCGLPYASYSYDANGNVTTGGGRDYVWTAFNKPLSLTRNGKTESFTYDADFERIKHVHTDGATSLYINPRLDSGAHFEIKKKGTSTEYTHHVYAGSEAVAAIVTLDTGPELSKYTQDFASGTTGLQLPTAAADPAGVFSWDASGQRLQVKTLNSSSSVFPVTTAATNLPTGDGVKLKVDVNLGADATSGGRYFAVGFDNVNSPTYSANGLRDVRALFKGDKLYALRALREPDGTVRQSTYYYMGSLADNSSYTLEMDVHDIGVAIYVYPKGTSRAQGYVYRTQVPQIDSARLFIVGRSGSEYSESTSSLDNLSLSSGGIQVGKNAPYERYLHKDHLGSIVATTDNQGWLLERFSYDAWGKRRKLDGNSDPAFDLAGTGSLLGQSTHHGFTGHEMLDDMTLVHMNGRIYDPVIGRFISADPNIDTLYSTQGLNSYSYVLNNPLNATDPTGYWSLKKAFKKLTNLLKKELKFNVEMLKYASGQKTNQFVLKQLGPELGQFAVTVGSAFCGPFVAVCYAAGSYDLARVNGVPVGQALRVAVVNGVSSWMFPSTATSLSGVVQQAAIQAVAAKNPMLGQLLMSVSGNWGGTGAAWAQNAIGQALQYVASEQMARVASKMGLTLQELNLLLRMNSRLGLHLAGTTYDEKNNGVQGFASRFTHPDLGVIWDVNDVLLNAQGIPDAVALSVAAKVEAMAPEDKAKLMKGHSLGAARVNILYRMGYIESAITLSLPVFAYPAAGTTSYCGQRDAICGGSAISVLRPSTTILSSPTLLDGVNENHRIDTVPGYGYLYYGD